MDVSSTSALQQQASKEDSGAISNRISLAEQRLADIEALHRTCPACNHKIVNPGLDDAYFLMHIQRMSIVSYVLALAM